MKNYSFFLLAIIACFVIGACSNELIEDSSYQKPIEELEITPYADNFQKPVLLPYDQYIDTLTQWGFYIKAEGAIGTYNQLQYSSSGYDWQTIEISNYSDIFINKKGYPYGKAHFRARYISSLKYKDDPSPAYSSNNISPWSDTMTRYNWLLPDGTPLTTNDFVVEFKFIFQYYSPSPLSAQQREALRYKIIEDFRVKMIFNDGANNGERIIAPTSFDAGLPDLFSYYYKTTKNSSGERTIKLTLSNNSPYWIIFHTAAYTFDIGSSTSVTPVNTITINVILND